MCREFADARRERFGEDSEGCRVSSRDRSTTCLAMTDAVPDVIARIVQQNLDVYRASPPRLQEDVSQEAQVASDYRGRLVYELLQNADDAMAESVSTSDRVAFLVTDDELWIANDGRALTEDDVQGLCGLGASSKIDTEGRRRASIGHKGLGFKSVLEVTDEPTVYSHTHCFALGERHARPVVSELWGSLGRPEPRSVPAMRFPAPAAADHPRWTAYAEAGFNTAFRFPFRVELPAAARRTVAELLLTLPLTTVLFLKHLELVEVRVEQAGRTEDRIWALERERREGEAWSHSHGLKRSGLYRVTIATEEETASFAVAHDADVRIGDRREGLSGPAWDGVDLTEVSVAAPLRRSDPVPEAWRRFHVFLPTAERCPYPFLVNGAFATDLSRQQVRVADDPRDYNAHLVRHAARLVREQVLPVLDRESPEAMLAALDRGTPAENAAADLLHRAVIAELRDVPLIPAAPDGRLKLGEALLPPAAFDELGETYRSVLPDEAAWEGRRFPSAPFCAGRWGRIAADHGARELTPADSLTVLARHHAPALACTVDDESGGFELDPLLELCSVLWHRTSGEPRAALEARARDEPLFPVHRHEDRTLERVTIGTDTAFYPPRSARQDLPLRGLRFMSHALCWGALNQNERQQLLAERMKAWTSLFEVREFRFETVVTAAITPALVRNPDPSAARMRVELEDERALAAICQLAGRATKADRPLRFQRLQSDRGLFNLSRLPVPCRSADGVAVWRPAYQVYFGADWIGADSVECLADAVPSEDPAALEFAYLAPPDALLGLLGSSGARANVAGDDDDEVDPDEDMDEAIETDERDRWIAFLSWIGVNSALRPIHFHDVEDGGTGWLTTKGLAQPQGWAFRGIGEPWAAFVRSVRNTLPPLAGVNAYFYDVHDLDQIGPLIAATERDAGNGLADALLSHLARHWSALQPFAGCRVALVDREKSPGQRAKPQRALHEELTSGGDNLWLHRLKRAGICPTSHGPRRPSTTWQPTGELRRRFGAGRRSEEDLLPVLRVPDGAPRQGVHAVADRLGVRGEPSPSTFSLDDARGLCKRLETLADGDVSLRDIRPVYRQLFELLSGQSEPAGALTDAPLLADTATGLQFLPSTEMLYAATPGIRERSGVAGRVPTFVLEAQPGANAPLANLFEMRSLEDALEWAPDPGECSLSEGERSAIRDGLNALVAPLLARIRVERSNARDVRVIREFVARLEPVDELQLTCTLDGEPLREVPSRSYFVDASGDAALRTFVVWEQGAPAWPPAPETAQALAMALADALGLNLVETFLAFIQSDPAQRRRLLDIAGGAGFLAEVDEELDHTLPEASDDSAPPPSPAPEAAAGKDEPAPTPGKPAPAPAPVPLLSFDQLQLEGDPIIVFGEVGRDEPGGAGNNAAGLGGAGHAAAGTDLRGLDALGMRIAMAYEVHRLRRAGHADVRILGPDDTGAQGTLVIDVHSPALIAAAESRSPAVRRVFAELEQQGISRLFPGFDILAVVDDQLDRAIELKSSGVDARVQAMSWNEWKTARHNHVSRHFWLYLVGNLRADLNQPPFVRAIHDPFGTLAADEVTSERRERAIQLRVREFREAEHLTLGVTESMST